MSLKKNISGEFIDAMIALGQEEIPAAVRLKAKYCMLDYLGVTFAGAKMMKKKLLRLCDLLGCERRTIACNWWRQKSVTST